MIFLSRYYQKRIKNKIGCVGDGNISYFDDVGKLHILYVRNEILPVQIDFSYVVFVDFSYMLYNKMDSNLLCVSVFIKYVMWYLVVIGRLITNEVWYIY